MLPKTKLNITEDLISKALIDSYVNHDAFTLINNLLKDNENITKVQTS